MAQPRIPKYRLHKASGQAVVTLSGRDIYLGKYDSPESYDAYRRHIAEWLASGRQVLPTASPSITVEEVLAAYWLHAQSYYVKDGKPSTQQHRVKMSLAPVRRLYGDHPATSFGPLALKAVREEMVRSGLNRRSVNQRIGCVKLCFKWAVSEELIPSSVYESLRTVEGLKAGRTTAPEPEPVLPVPQADIDAIEGEVLPTVWDIIQVQLLTGCRPGEACEMHVDFLDQSGKVWEYRPSKHKMAYRQREKLILIGPRCQEILEPYLDFDGYLFSPDRALREYQESNGQIYRPGRKPGKHYTSHAYAKAIRKGCVRAKVTPWHPHRLRHNAATLIVEQFSWDVARTILGHRSLDTTRIYGEDAIAKAKDALEKIG